MKDLIVFINEKSDCNFKDLQFFDAVYDKNNNILNIQFVSISKNKYKQEQINILKTYVQEYIENKCEVTVSVKNSKFSIDICLQKIKEIINKNQMYQMAFDIDKITAKNIDENTINLTLVVDKNFDNNQKENFENLVLSDLKLLSDYNYNFEYIERIVDYSNIINIRKEEFETDLENNFIDLSCKITKQKNFLGKMDEVSSAMMIENLKSSIKNTVYVAGFIRNIKNINTVKKDDTNKQINFVKFELYNDITSVDCVCFLKLSADLLNLTNGQSVVVKAEIDNFNDILNLRVFGLALCEITLPKIPLKKAPKNYKIVKPTPYIVQEQASFLDVELKTKHEYLLNNTFVVFDLETTGLDTNTCKIVEIGAVKIVEGVIVSQFSTFVNPQEHIPEQATLKNNITDDMVKDAPTIEQVFPDFYKFIENSVLVAHNIGYDFPIINRYAKSFGYEINNEKQDTLLLSQKHLGQLKKHILSKVCEHFNIPLINAHRAVNDTIATAKVFLKLVENYF